MTLFVEVPEVVSSVCLVWQLGLGWDSKLMKALEKLIYFVNPASVSSKDTATVDGSKIWTGCLRQIGRWWQALLGTLNYML